MTSWFAPPCSGPQSALIPAEMHANKLAWLEPTMRTVGWVAQWEEMLLDQETKIARPKQIYNGHGTRDYGPMDKR